MAAYEVGRRYNLSEDEGIGNYRHCTAAFPPQDLVIVNALPPEEWDLEEHGDESWANVLCQQAEDRFSAPDIEGTTDGNPRGINILIPRSALADWSETAEELGIALTESKLAVTAGHYGDGQWEGVDLVAGDDGRLYWFEA